MVDEKGEGRGGGASGFMVGIGECARENHVEDYPLRLISSIWGMFVGRREGTRQENAQGESLSTCESSYMRRFGESSHKKHVVSSSGCIPSEL